MYSQVLKRSCASHAKTPALFALWISLVVLFVQIVVSCHSACLFSRIRSLGHATDLLFGDLKSLSSEANKGTLILRTIT